MDTRERIQGYLKTDLQEVIYEKNVADADVRAGAAERRRPRRSARLSDDAPRRAQEAYARIPDRVLRVSHAGRAAAGDRRSRPQDLLDGLKDPTRWLTFGGDYSGQRHSPLTQITPDERRPARRRSGRSRPARSATSRRRRSSSTACSTSPASTTTRGRSTRAPGAQIWRYRRELPERPDTSAAARSTAASACSATAVHDARSTRTSSRST